MRRRLAGSPPQWRRSGQAGVGSGIGSNAIANSTVACRLFLARRPKYSFRRPRLSDEGMGSPHRGVEAHGKNSNAAIVWSRQGSKFIAEIRPATGKIFSVKIQRIMADLRPYPGAN